MSKKRRKPKGLRKFVALARKLAAVPKVETQDPKPGAGSKIFEDPNEGGRGWVSP